MKILLTIISILGRIITAGLFIGGIALMAQQVNSGNNGGALLGIGLLVVLVWNILLKDELRAMQKHLRETRSYAQKFWEYDDI
jgi:hypothetical protein